MFYFTEYIRYNHMSNLMRGRFLPKWTSSKDDINWPWTHILVALIASLTPVLAYSVPYAASGESVPLGVSLAILSVYFIFVPALALREATEVLFDGTQISLRITLLGFLLFMIAFWATPEQTGAFATLPRMVSFAVTIIGLYGSIILGLVWAIQYTRKGTSGVNTEFQ